MQFVLWFEHIRKDYGALVGGKGANLGEMVSFKMPVPEGFVITTDAFNMFIELNKIKERIQQLIAACDVDNTAQLFETSRQIKNLIVNGQYPSEIKSQITKSYNELSTSRDIKIPEALALISAGREYPLVAVRSSATTEDLPTASFAGQQASFLNVKGVTDLLENVKKCWASLFEPRAIFYRSKHGFSSASIAVVVQRMISSEKSGVMFTVNPASGENEIVIEATWGLGETLVLGEVEPDRYRATKDGTIIETKIGKKEKMKVRDVASDRTIDLKVPRDKIEQQVLSEYEIKKLAQYGVEIENHYGKPQDVEFAIERDRIYIVQTRAVTTEAKEKAEEISGEVLVKGLGASPGIGSGIVRIIHSMDDLTKIQKGDILVTEMTSPDMVVGMSKSAGIITDNGGQTCFGGDTSVLTNFGPLPIKEVYEKIRNGKKLKVLSINSNNLKCAWKKIIVVTKREGKLTRVSVSQRGQLTDNTLDLTPDHKLFTFEGFNFVSKPVKDILDNNEMVCSVYKIPQLGYTFEDDDLSYLSGAIFSDGWIKLTPRHGAIVFSQKNTPEKSNFISAVSQEFEDAFGTELKDRGIDVGIGNIRGREVIGDVNRYVSYRKFPAERLLKFKNKLLKWCMSTDKENLNMFLAGLIDGDGSISPEKGRFHIYSGKEFLYWPIVLASLRLGIIPQVCKNRTCFNFQLVGEGIDNIGLCLKRVKKPAKRKRVGYRFFAAKQILNNIVGEVNYKGRIRPYVKGNLLIDAEKIKRYLIPLASANSRKSLEKIVNSDLSMIRIRKVDDIGFSDVFNLTIDAKKEEDHNYIVFTKRFTPLVVSNCHAAIVSREMGIPAIVGTRDATKILHDGQEITVDAFHGAVYAGAIEIKKPEVKISVSEKIPTKIAVKVNVAFAIDNLEDIARVTDGVGLLRIEHMVAKSRIHPAKLIRENRSEEYIKILIDGIKPIASAFEGKPVWVRTLDARSDEFKNLEGGGEEEQEANPMLGWHGIRRSLDETELLKAEFEAVKRLHEEGLTNVHVMLPFVIYVDELRKARDVASEVGLPESVRVGIMCETPACAVDIEEFCKEGVDFVSIGSNDLTQLVLGVDRGNAKISGLYSEFHPSMLALMKRVIETCNQYDVESSICGESGSNPEMVEKLVQYGIRSVSCNIDAIEKIRETVEVR